ncbi:uncharacterized protein [Panulirus ornatus]|uniref:uncharacterized protein n=1 Tax=Panulirus ornatus TaxID=150431 RepID=UPI003A8AB41D
MRLQAAVVTALVALATAGGVQQQCLTEYAGSDVNTDLTGVTDFGLDLYRQLSPANSSSNFFFSPYSIWTALSMAYLGSNGDTKRQLETALRVTDKTSTYRLLSILKKIYREKGNSAHYSFTVANRIYYDSLLPLRQCIKSLLPEEVKDVNFSDNTGSADIINNFVSTTTNGRIKDIISSADLQNIVMVLVNAAYFKGTWVNQFQPHFTTKVPFNVTSRDTIDVDMMQIRSKFRYAESQQLRAHVLEVPYNGNEMSMVLLLPTKEGPQGFQEMVASMSGANLRTVLDTGLKERPVYLQLPRFKLEHTIKEQLVKGLENLGVRDLFNKGAADLSDFVLHLPLFVSKAVHKAFVEVNEEGTEAAAATALAVDIRSGHSSQVRPVRFICNRPFLFFIYEKFTRNVLFFGAYRNPATYLCPHLHPLSPTGVELTRGNMSLISSTLLSGGKTDLQRNYRVNEDTDLGFIVSGDLMPCKHSTREVRGRAQWSNSWNMRLQAAVVVVVVAVALATVGSIHPDCFTEYDKGGQINTDLTGITDFGFDLYRQLSPANSSSNIFFSPYSIWTALSLAYLGSNGDTKRQLETALRVTDKPSTYRLLDALKTMYRGRANNPHYSFSVANRIYYDSNLRLDSYIKSALQDELQGINPRDSISEAKAINSFVSSVTNGRIKEMVTARDLPSVVMLLLNAVYFKGTWLNLFNPSSTVEEQFYVTPQQSVPVNMMHNGAKYRHAESQQLKAHVLEVPYNGNEMSMVLLLPTEEGPQGFREMVAAMSGANLRTVLDTGLQERTVYLKLPRFKLEKTLEDELMKALQNLGVRDLFNSLLANMSGFSQHTPLYVSRAVHKAFVEVNEEGTEAAAATVLMYHRSAKRHVFTCNRPFLFLIHDSFTRSVLFIGAYMNPAT